MEYIVKKRSDGVKVAHSPHVPEKLHTQRSVVIGRSETSVYFRGLIHKASLLGEVGDEVECHFCHRLGRTVVQLGFLVNLSQLGHHQPPQNVGPDSDIQPQRRQGLHD